MIPLKNLLWLNTLFYKVSSMVLIQDIPIFCVNLEEATDRWNQILAQAEFYSVPIHHWKASRAVDTAFIEYQQTLTGGQRACALSHFNLWNHAIQNNFEYILILEDDALFRKDWISVLNQQLETLESQDPSWDAIFLNCSEEISPPNTWSVVKRQAMTAGYLIRKHAIQFLLNTFQEKLACADWMTQILQERGHSYSIFPWLVIQDGSSSFIQSDNSPDYQKVLRLLNSIQYPIENYRIHPSRISWKEYFKELALLVSKRSPCSRLHVGCVLVKDNHIISTGYNGFLPGASHISIVVENHEQATVHAEQNCIADCAKRGVNTLDSHAYITHYPCVNCFKILVAAGISKVFYIDDYKNSPIVQQLSIESSVPISKL
jgi:dCMP deaminase